MSYERLSTDEDWGREVTDGMPSAWQSRVLGAWRASYPAYPFDADPVQHNEARRAANSNLAQTVELLDTVHIPLDASDGDIVEAAKTLAARCQDAMPSGHLVRDQDWSYAKMLQIVQDQGLTPPKGKHMTAEGAMARMCEPLWWRRKLRVQHGRAVEAAAIRLGYVNKSREIYVSGETVRRRLQQNTRNARTLETTEAQNEDGEIYTLAELAALGPGNKAIRRNELMTRIAGFEAIANELQDAGTFMTITCPSRFHKWRTIKLVRAGRHIGDKVVENKRYDLTTDPRQAAQYLGKVWARIRAALARVGIKLYGFRVAEPQQDGTPHWHLLVFHPKAQAATIRSVVYEQAMKDTPDEPGAHSHRCDFKDMGEYTDRNGVIKRGSAAGYIIKYIAKNIDGYGVGKDLYGHDAITTSLRVEAWASTWGIRQFQQIGGAPVTVWRELRRVKSLPEDAPDAMVDAHKAVNKLNEVEGKENPSVSWAAYTLAQGGVAVGRHYLVRVTEEQRLGEMNRYREQASPKPVGVEAMGPRGLCRARSRRYQWTIRQSRFDRHCAHRAPWTGVINCTPAQKNFDRDAVFLNDVREPDLWLKGKALAAWEKVHGPSATGTVSRHPP